MHHADHLRQGPVVVWIPARGHLDGDGEGKDEEDNLGDYVGPVVHSLKLY